MTIHTPESLMEMAFDYRTASGNGEVVEKRLALTHAYQMVFAEINRLKKLVGEHQEGTTPDMFGE